ncbi:hypothetical protein [Streptomyces sp. NBC_00425]|uniref:hypothetical protein n=1 Tax=Streptomyces sp. NBC_00425 TaxID=2975740 RepID=UPI002E1EBB06
MGRHVGHTDGPGAAGSGSVRAGGPGGGAGWARLALLALLALLGSILVPLVAAGLRSALWFLVGLAGLALARRRRVVGAGAHRRRQRLDSGELGVVGVRVDNAADAASLVRGPHARRDSCG